jgi:hypothetical protein
MIKQWPHIARAIRTADSTIDENGNIVPGVDTEVQFICRYRQNPGSKSINTVDGQTIIYKGTIIIKEKNTGLKYGDMISVDGFIDKAPIIQVMPHQFRPRIIV